MAQTNLTIRIDEDIKREAETLFNAIGLNMSAAVNVFFRQAILEQAIPFPIRATTSEEKYSEYFNPNNMRILMESIEQAKAGQVITFTMSELEAMERGEIPKRASDFLEKNKKQIKGQ